MTNLLSISYKCEYVEKEFVDHPGSEEITLVRAVEMTSTGGYHYTFIDNKNVAQMKMGKASEEAFISLAGDIPDEIFDEKFVQDFNRELIDADSTFIERTTIEKTFANGDSPITWSTVLLRDILRYSAKTPQIFLLTELAIAEFLRKLRGDV